jgi:hypothetical protein
MKTRLTLKPGQNGTKKLVAKYGTRLVAVRYRYDPEYRPRLKTVELIEEQLQWDPVAPPGREPNALVLLRVGLHEERLRQSVKAAGGIWLHERKLWQLSYRLASVMGLADRIVGS